LYLNVAIFTFYCRYFLSPFDLFIVTPLLKYTMVLKGAATMIVRISRAIISHPIKPIFPPRAYDIPQINKNSQVYSKYPIRYYLFPSVYRSFFSSYGPSIGHYQQNLPNLLPFRAALDEIKRRLFFAGLCFRSLFFFFIRSFIYIYAYHFSQFVHPLDINEKQREKEEFLWLFWRTFALKNELMPYREEKVVIIKPTREKKNVNSPLYSSSSSFACTST
jgi:hypothetical protein